MLTFLFRLKGQFLGPQKCNKRGSLFFVYFYLYVQSDAVIFRSRSFRSVLRIKYLKKIEYIFLLLKLFEIAILKKCANLSINEMG